MPYDLRSNGGGGARGGDAKVPPMFSSVSSQPAWEGFLERYDAYCLAIAGDEGVAPVPIRQCIQPSQIPLLRIRLRDVDLAAVSNADLIVAMWKRWTPPTKHLALQEFDRLAQQAKSPMSRNRGAFDQYVAKHMSLWGRLPASVRPALKRVRTSFLSGIEPRALREHLAEELASVEGYDEMIAVTLTECDDLRKGAGIFGADSDTSSRRTRGGRRGEASPAGGGTGRGDTSPGSGAGGGPPSGGSAGGGRSNPPSGGGAGGGPLHSSRTNGNRRGPVTCHHCGEVGHIRPECPNRERSPAPRSNKLSAEFAPSAPSATAVRELAPVPGADMHAAAFVADRVDPSGESDSDSDSDPTPNGKSWFLGGTPVRLFGF